MKRQQLSQGAEIIQPTPTFPITFKPQRPEIILRGWSLITGRGGGLQNGRGGGMRCFTPTKREGGKGSSHAEGVGTKYFGVVFRW